MRMDVPSLAPGARTLPAELRTPQHIPRGNAWGWHRLHENLTPVTDGGMNGLGAQDLIPVDLPVPMPPVRALPDYSGGGMPTYIQSLISQGLISPTTPGKPPNAPPGARLQHTPWGYLWAHIVKTQNGPVIMWMSERPDVVTGITGLGSCIDPSAYDYNPADCMAPTDTSGGVYETPYPVVFSDGSTGTLSATDWANLINSSTNALTRTLAITQGGSVSASGNIYGSPQTATAAAQAVPYGSLQIGAGGASAMLSSPVVLIALGALVFLMVSKK